jgi:hypothetical protein
MIRRVSRGGWMGERGAVLIGWVCSQEILYDLNLT